MHLGEESAKGCVTAESAPPSLLEVLEAVHGIAEGPWLQFELGVDHVVVDRQEDDKLATCHGFVFERQIAFAVTSCRLKAFID